MFILQLRLRDELIWPVQTSVASSATIGPAMLSFLFAWILLHTERRELL
jgi:hypothetical protein